MSKGKYVTRDTAEQRLLHFLEVNGPSTVPKIAAAVQTTPYYVTYICENNMTVDSAQVETKRGSPAATVWFMRGDPRSKRLCKAVRIRYFGLENLTLMQATVFETLLARRGRLLD